MLTWPHSVKVFVCSEPTDMRRSFDRLAFMAQDIMGQDPLSGHLFVYFNRVGDKCKILFWDRTGYCLWYKRLEKGVFRLPAKYRTGSGFEIDIAQLSLVLEGINLDNSRQFKRYSLR